MTDATRIFEYADDKSSKFWEISRAGDTVTVRYGKTGTNGQTQDKVFADSAVAEKHVAKLIAEKTGKGYVERGGVTQSQEPVSTATPSIAATQKAPVQASKGAKAVKPKSPLQDPDATPESLLAWLNKDDSTNRQLAKHLRASAELLEKLSHSSDEATRRNVAANPNTLSETFIKLGQQFPKEFLANPALDLMLLINPALMDEVPDALLVRLLKRDDCPISMLTWASAQWSENVQLAVAMNAAAPEQALQRLRESRYPAVREAVELKPITNSAQDPEREFEQAVRDRLGSLKPHELLEAWSSGDIGLAQWSVLPLTFRLAKAANDGFTPQTVVRGLRHENRMHKTFREICFNYLEDSVIVDVARSPDTPTSVLKVFSNFVSFNDRVRQAVLENPSTPLTVLERFSSLNVPYRYESRVGVAENPAAPKILLELLSKNSNPHVRGVVANKRSTPAYLLEGLTNDIDTGVRRRLAENTSTPVPTLAVLSKDIDRTVRINVAGNSSTSLEVLMLLAEDTDNRIQIAVAENSAVTDLIREQLLVQLSKHSDPRTRMEVIENPKMPLHLLEVFSSDSEAWVRGAVAANKSTPLHTLEALSRDSASSVRKNVAENPATPSSLLEKLGTDSNDDVKIAVVGNQNTPDSVLIKLVAAKAVSVRQALAAQAHRSSEVRNKLWRDANSAVRRAVATCRGLEQEVLDELVHDLKLEGDLVNLFGHPHLSASSVEYIAEKLLDTPATSSAWYQSELVKAKADLRETAEADNILNYNGKDPNKAVLAKRPMAALMALCAGPFIEVARIVKVAGSTDWLIRSAVARNPGTPPNILKKLCADPHNLVSALARCNLHKHEEVFSTKISTDGHRFLSDRVVQEIVERVKDESQLTILSFFCDDSWCDHLTAPQICWLTLIDSSSEEDSFWPNFPFRLFQQKLDPECIALMIELAVMFNGAAAVSNPSVKAWAAKESICPLHVLKLLVNDDVPEIAISAMTNEVMRLDAGDSFKQQLLGLRGKKLRALLGSDCVPLEMLEEKSRSKDKDVRCAIAANTMTPASLLTEFSTDLDDAVRSALAGNLSAPVSVLKLLSEDKHPGVRGAVASNVSTEVDVLHVLARDSNFQTRASVARNPFAAAYTLEKLAVDKDLFVREELAHNPKVPAHLFQTFIKDEGNKGGGLWDGLCSFRGGITGPRFNFNYSAMNSIIYRHEAVAKNPATPAEILTILAKDGCLEYCFALAENPSIPFEILKVLDRRKNRFSEINAMRLMISIAKNPSLSIPMLETRSRSVNLLVRQAVAMNASTPESVLVRMAGEGPFDVEIAVAMNPSTPSFCRDRALEKWVVRLQRSIQREKADRKGDTANPRAPVSPADLLKALNLLGVISPTDDNKALSKASRSKDWLTRLGVALHPLVTEGILKVLRQDKDPDVASAAASNRLVTNS